MEIWRPSHVPAICCVTIFEIWKNKVLDFSVIFIVGPPTFESQLLICFMFCFSGLPWVVVLLAAWDNMWSDETGICCPGRVYWREGKGFGFALQSGGLGSVKFFGRSHALLVEALIFLHHNPFYAFSTAGSAWASWSWWTSTANSMNW